jgi:hypothetical protein
MLRVWRAVTVGGAVFLLVATGFGAGAGAGGGLNFSLLFAEGAALVPALPVYGFRFPIRGLVGKEGGVGGFTTGEGAGAGAAG